MNIEMLTCFSMNVKLQGGKHKKRTQTNYKPNAEKTLLQLNDNQTVTTRVIYASEKVNAFLSANLLTHRKEISTYVPLSHAMSACYPV